MGRESAHGVKGDRIAGDAVVILAPRVRPRDRQLDLLVAGGHAHFMSEPADAIGRNARDALGPFGRVVGQPVDEQLKSGLYRRAILQPILTEKPRVGAVTVRDHRTLFVTVPPQLVLRIEATLLFRNLGTHEQAVLVARLVHVDQLRGVRVAHQELAIE